MTRTEHMLVNVSDGKYGLNNFDGDDDGFSSKDAEKKTMTTTKMMVIEKTASDTIVMKETLAPPTIPSSIQKHAVHSYEDAFVFASSTHNESSATKIRNQIVLESLKLF